MVVEEEFDISLSKKRHLIMTNSLCCRSLQSGIAI